LIDSIKQTLREPIWIVLAGSAVIAGIIEACISEWDEFWANLAEPLAIILMALFLIAITAFADLIKDKKFIDL
jgi:hypothetical protein